MCGQFFYKQNVGDRMKIKLKTKIIFILMMLSIFIVGCTNVDSGDSTDNLYDVFEDDPQKTTLYFFWGDGCPHCANQKPYLDRWQDEYPQLEVKEFEVYSDEMNRQIYSLVAEEYGLTAGPVPVTFIGDEYWVGFSESRMVREMETKIEECIAGSCKSPGVRVLEGT